MEDVSEFINNPGDKDVPVSAVFTPAMFEELCTAMTAAGFEGVDQVRTRWETEYKDRKIITEVQSNFKILVNFSILRCSFHPLVRPPNRPTA